MAFPALASTLRLGSRVTSRVTSGAPSGAPSGGPSGGPSGATPGAPLVSGASEVSTTLPIGAGAAYEVFVDAVEIPRWLPLVQAARVLSRDDAGRAARVAFTRKLERGSLGYTLEYHYEPGALTVSWATLPSSNVVLTGEARFVPLSNRACLMLYRLVLELPIVDDLLTSELDRHPASLVVSEFREHLRRLC